MTATEPTRTVDLDTYRFALCGTTDVRQGKDLPAELRQRIYDAEDTHVERWVPADTTWRCGGCEKRWADFEEEGNPSPPRTRCVSCDESVCDECIDAGEDVCHGCHEAADDREYVRNLRP